MDKKQDSGNELLNEIKELIDDNKLIEIREILDEYHTVDIYDVLLELDEVDRLKLFELLPLETAASIFEECDLDFFNYIITSMDVKHVRSIFDEMSLGDLAEILRELDKDEREKILDIVSKEDEEELRELLAYVDESSGSTMKKGYVTVNKNLNVADAIKHIRKEAMDADSIYYIYVIDNEQRLVGVLSLRDLFLSKDTSIIEDIMVENIKTVADTDDREEAVKLVSKYNLVAIPVLDKDEKLKGIITVDDILDVMEEEATEDLYKFAGSSEHERDVAGNEKSTFIQQVISCVRGRSLWLALSFVVSFLSVYVFMNLKELSNTEFFQLIFFAPLIAAMGGNVASQSASVTIINLTNKNKDVDLVTIFKELVSAFINSLIVIIIAIILLSIFVGKVNISIIISITLVINMILGATLGTLVPMLFEKLELDPTVISAPMLTVAMDVIGILVYFIIISNFVI